MADATPIPSQPKAGQPSPRSGFPLLVLTVAISGISGWFGGMLWSGYDSTHKSTANPPVAVVDYAAIQAAAARSGLSPDVVLQQTLTALEKLKRNGYLVLDAQAIAVAPPDVYLTPDVLGVAAAPTASTGKP